MRLAVASILVGALAVLTSAQPRSSLDAAFRAFWAADGASRRAGTVADVLATGASYDELAARLKTGPLYGSAPTGRIKLPTSDRGVALDNVVDVPADYAPSRRWPLRVTLHGGVGRQAPGENDPPPRPLSDRVPIAGELVLHPRAWSGSEWWTAGQVENIHRLVDRVKRNYNVDESRTYVTGFSDGGTGVYFLAMRAATLWAACLPLHGHPLVLANADYGIDGMLFSGNLANCALHVVNGGRDPLYPAASVEPIVSMLRRGGIPVDFVVYPDAGHDASAWPVERPRYEAFLAAHLRAAHPERISWETERTDRYNRFRWLVINRVGSRGSDRPLADVNRFNAGSGTERPLFARPRQSGRVDVTRRGNTFEAETRGVATFTLLLSPDVVDFGKPVRVVVNGRTVHDRVVEKSTQTMMAWAARDFDRTMLYGAELTVTVP